MDFIIPLQFALVPVLIGVNEVIKNVGVPTRFIPVFSLALGIGGSFLVPGVSTVFVAVVGGVVIGLSAVGLYSSTRAVAKKK